MILCYNIDIKMDFYCVEIEAFKQLSEVLGKTFSLEKEKL